MDEHEAISKLRRGDVAGLEALVRLYQVQALKVAYLTTRNYALAEDLVQTAFLRAYERISQFDNTRSFGPWFLRSVVNSALTAVTTAADRRELSLESYEIGQDIELPSLDPDLHDMLEKAETKAEVLAALEELTPIQRAAVIMRYYLDLSDNEMARRLDVPPGTVRRRLHDARQRLRNLLPKWIG